MPRTQEERKAETRTRLLEAAAELFARQGIDAVSVDAVAEAAGRTSGSVYAHFGSKQGLLMALLDWWKGSVLAALLAQVALAGSSEGQLRAVWRHLAGTDGDGDRWSLLEQELWLRAARDDEVAAVVRSRDSEGRRYVARELAGWTATTTARPVADPEGLAVLVKALVSGLVWQRRIDPTTVPEHLALRGLAALVGLVPGTETADPSRRGRQRSSGTPSLARVQPVPVPVQQRHPSPNPFGGTSHEH